MSTDVKTAAALSREHAGTLEQLLTALEQCYVQMRQLLAEHREAIAQADAGRIAKCVQAEQSLVVRLASLDSQRAALARQLAAGAGRSGKVTLTSLAERAPEPNRSRLVAIAARVKALMGEVTQRQEVIRLASMALLAHMQGMVRQITHSMSSTGTYSRPGAPGAMAGAGTGLLDVTT